jgi:hypothetical protein
MKISFKKPIVAFQCDVLRWHVKNNSDAIQDGGPGPTSAV